MASLKLINLLVVRCGFGGGGVICLLVEFPMSVVVFPWGGPNSKLSSFVLFVFRLLVSKIVLFVYVPITDFDFEIF